MTLTLQYLNKSICVFWILFMCNSQWTFAQEETLNSTVKANFGVDADVKSGTLKFSNSEGPNTDDWFLGTTGRGVIDVSNQDIINRLNSGENITTTFGMSQPFNSIIDGNLWLDAVYFRDYYSHNNEKDVTVFGGGDDKNFNDPTTWTIKKGSVPPKNDIIDVYGHLRQDVNSEFWLFGGVSTRTQNGDHYIDFEYFRNSISLNSNTQNLISEGEHCGHTAYELDIENNDKFVVGDVILSVNYINGGTKADFRFYIWINSEELKGLDDNPSSLSDADFIAYNKLPNKRFDFGYGQNGDYENYNYEFYPCDNDSKNPYGYARISFKSNNSIFAQDNTAADVDSPSWGTIGSDGSVIYSYEKLNFLEFALNTTLLGLDGTLTNNACSKPLGTVIVKTRTSASFTSELKDFAGPFSLGATPQFAVTINEPQILTCAVSEIILTASTSETGSFSYHWFKDNVPFDDDTPGDNTLKVTKPGIYSVEVIVSDQCIAKSNSVQVFQNTIKPNVSALGGVLDCSLGEIQLNGSIFSNNLNAELSFEWLGPNGFVNSTELNPMVSSVGNYTLTVTDKNNGCINSAVAVVSSNSELPIIECPPTIEVQCIEDIPYPNINSVVIINSGAGSPLVQFVNDISNNQSCPETITRTYSITDVCGNIKYCSQLIIVFDTIIPEITDIPDYKLAGCNTPWPTKLTTTWSDNCSAGGSIDSDAGVPDGQSEDGCVQYRKYTFAVTDDCGNSDNETTRVARDYDMTNPEIADIPDYKLTGCNTPWPTKLTTTWTDNCTTGGSIESDSGVDLLDSPDGCTQYRLYTFSIIDYCGNSDTETTIVSRGNSVDIEDLPDFKLEHCNDAWPEFLTTNWTNSCTNESGEIQSGSGVDDGQSEDGCTQYRLYTFIIANCGDIETTRVAREYDMTTPEIFDLPDYEISCASWPEYLTTTWTDNCSVGGTINSDAGVNGGISEDGTREFRLYTFTVSDDCGNTDTETTTVTRLLSTIEISCPAMVEVQCIEDVPGPDISLVTITNPGAGSIVVEFMGDVSDNQSCPQTITRTYRATDVCGNTAECTQTIKVNDTTNPEIFDLPDYEISCASWPEYLTTTWTDNCSIGGTVDSDSGVDGGISEDGLNEYRLYTFTFIDECGNSDTETTTVTRQLSTIEIVCSPMIEVQCIEDVPGPDINSVTIISPEAGSLVIEFVDDVSDGQSCPQTIIRTYRATDVCGNTAECIQTIKVNDTINPEIVDITDYQIGCNEEWPTKLTTIWTDNCSIDGTVDSDGGVDGGISEDGLSEYWLYTFTVTDECGNTDTETTLVNREIANGDKIIGDEIQLCRDYGEFDLDFLLPDAYKNLDGTWMLYATDPQDLNINIASGLINVIPELSYGEYIFHYKIGCLLIIEVKVILLEAEPPCVLPCSSGEISTAVTPNNDNVNETFNAGIASGGSCTVDVQIFNRWGDKIFEAKNYKNDWNGSVQSNALGKSNKIPTGTYYYIIYYKEENSNEVQTKRGYFYIATE